jgi:hypothetical protein
MGCILALISLAFPRFVILLLVLTGDYIGRAYATTIWPLLGFVFMPMTTLSYAWAVNQFGGVHGLGLAAVILAVLLDLGLLSFSNHQGQGELRRRRKA